MALTALRGKKIARKKAPAARRQRGKTADPSWTDALKMSGEAYHKYKRKQIDFYYDDKKPIDVFPDLLAWMKDNNYSKGDIALVKKHGHSGMIYAGIYARCLRNGMPDVHSRPILKKVLQFNTRACAALIKHSVRRFCILSARLRRAEKGTPFTKSCASLRK